MKKSIIAIACLLTSVAALGQEPDAVYKLISHRWEVSADGYTTYRHRHEVQILRNRALTAYADKGETFVVYNPDIDELTLNEVYTVRPDGSRVEMPQNAFVYQLPSGCTDCGRYNHLRELAMVHTGMEIGCTVVVDYTLRRHASQLSQTLPLVQNCPVEMLEVSVQLPEDQTLNVRLTNPGYLAFSPDETIGSHNYRLRVDNLPPSYADSYLPAARDLYPMLHFSNGSIAYQPVFYESGFDGAAPVVAQVAAKGTPSERVTAIRNLVVDNIHLNTIAPDLLSYTHATAAEVWQSACGTATDKAVLLAAILNHEGIRAHVAGEHADEVGVVIDSLEYRLSVLNKSPLTLYGEAIDEATVRKSSRTHDDVSPDTLADGYFSLPLRKLEGIPAIDVRNLARTRTAPVQSAICDVEQADVYVLPKGMKMLEKEVAESLHFDGVGSASVSIRQSGRKLKVVRRLALEQNVVEAANYADFRSLLLLCQKHTAILLQSK